MAISCDHQPFIAKAPIVLIFLADPNRLWDLYRAGQVPESCNESGEAFIQKPALSDLMLASCDAMAAAQNVVIAAQSLGLGSCYIGDIMEQIEEHREMLGLPSSVFPLTMLVIGYPTEAASRRKQTDRYPLWAMTFENHYKSLTPKELATMTGKEDIKKEALRIYKKKTGADFSFEMRRSVKKGSCLLPRLHKLGSLPPATGKIDKRGIADRDDPLEDVGRDGNLDQNMSGEGTEEGNRGKDHRINELADHGADVISQPNKTSCRQLLFPHVIRPDIMQLAYSVSDKTGKNDSRHGRKSVTRLSWAKSSAPGRNQSAIFMRTIMAIREKKPIPTALRASFFHDFH